MRQIFLFSLFVGLGTPPALATNNPDCLDPVKAKIMFVAFVDRIRVAKNEVDLAMKSYAAASADADKALHEVRLKWSAGEIEIAQKRELLLGGPEGVKIERKLLQFDRELNPRLLLIEKINSLVQDQAVRERVGCQVGSESIDFLREGKDLAMRLSQIIVNETSLLRAALENK